MGCWKFSPPRARSSRGPAAEEPKSCRLHRSDIANFWLLYTVNSHIPVLSHLLQGRRCHPEELFSALTALGASLTTFSATIRPRDLPLYDHLELSKVFHDLDQKLRLLLETVVPTNVVSLPLKHVKNTIYATGDRARQIPQQHAHVRGNLR